MPARILVVEDNQENRELMTYLLTAFGHTVFAAQDGEEGLEAARRELPDLVLSDLQMPKVDGYELARSFRQDPRLATRPLVAVTSYAMRGDREKVLAAGFDAYISKPIVPEEFVNQVERFLDPAQHSLGPPILAGSDPLPGPMPYHATILAVDNSPVNLSLIQSTLEPFGYKVIRAASVNEAIAYARTRAPDLILSDLHMPDADGFDFFEAVRAEPSLKSVPFAIISSTFWPSSDLAQALNLGISRFILRPIEPLQLVEEIKACLAGCPKILAEENKRGNDFDS